MNEIEIIAEIGINHDGSFTQACRLIDAAKDAGCDTVKFQLWNADRIYPGDADMKRLEIPPIRMVEIKEYAETVGVRFLCTPDDIHDARILRGMDVKRIKIGSSNITNLPLLREIASWEIPVILSTGACTGEEVWNASQEFRELAYLHCVSCYPAPEECANLLIMRELGRGLSDRIQIGLSDHFLSTDIALVAIGLGARLFEKHLTLDHLAPGPDHAISLEPGQMEDYVMRLRAAAKALGDGVKIIQKCEVENRKHYDEFVRRQVC